MTNNLNDKPGVANNRINLSGSNKKLIIIIMVAVVLSATIWIGKNIQVKNEREEAQRKMQVFQGRAALMITDTHKEHLRVLAQPYVWAIRNEILSGNIKQVHVYANEMVKEKNFQSIVVANDKGIIISSTNKKNEGAAFTTIGKPAYLSSGTTIVETINDSLFAMSSPVMGFNNRLGTLMITYRVRKPAFNSPG